MNIKFASVVAAVLLASGCAQNGTVKPPAEPDDSAPIAGATSGGTPSAASAQYVGPAGVISDSNIVT